MKPLLLILIVTVMSSGCTWIARKKQAVEVKMDEGVRENNQAADIANQRGRAELIVSNFPGALVAYDLSDVMIRRNQASIGLPVVDQVPRVDRLLLNDADEVELEAKRVRLEQDWKREWNSNRAKLELRGQIAEEQRNKSIWRRFWSWFTGLGIIGMVVAVCFFFPVVLPILGRIIGWIVGKIPAAAGYIGAVSTTTLDRIYKGIEKTKVERGEDDETVKTLRANLSTSMDQDQKDLIANRRKHVPVETEPKITVVNERADPDRQQ